MDVDGFWAMIERSAQEMGTRAERLAWLEERLSALPVVEIVDYKTWWTIAANRGCSWDMYAVYWTLMGSGSSDGFEYFVSWLISLGREAFETVADCPDAVVDLPQVQHVLELERTFFRGYRRVTWSKDEKFRLTRLTRRRRDVWTREEWPEFELMGYVTYEPHRKVTGLETDSLGDAVRARGVESKFPFLTYHAEPDGAEWDFEDEAEFIRRLPRIARHRGITRSKI
ncbi:DUF4240 domain-containing protein [Nonomuraea muscovyensis]